MARVRPFPWASLDSTTRTDEAARCDARRWATKHLNIEGIRAALSDVLGTEVETRIRRVRPFSRPAAFADGPPPSDDGVGVVLAAADAREGEGRVLLEVERALAAEVVARVLRRASPPVLRPSVPPSAALAGAFAAVVVATARRAHAGIAMRVLDAGPAAGLEAETARLEPELVAISVTVVIAHEAFAARVVVPRSATTGLEGPGWSREALSALGDTPLAVPLVACRVEMTTADVAALRTGDAMVPSRRSPLSAASSAWDLEGGAGRALRGSVFLAAPSWAVGHRAEFVQDGRLVLRGEVESLDAAETNMEENERAGLIASVGEVPVMVRVEIGEAVMPAREWAALRQGDVVALGRRVGESVLLRVAGLPVARGELVSIEGEVGVRIIERMIGQTAAP